ncbi:hypothetical protein C8046_06730 [Serinibacter arcticus]|uniref:Glycosyltransferase n=1 Tax=Serinibacter arcticus TaxID=1655435 RepID=A0A2U1ZTW8_9MICO|nr:polysaccharide pyruvyl transferase family protein [Serinibacter arcticus]PWD50390.1 hypothetical protein C8046_06730 [Serinibacter arcticus]
MRVAVVGDIGQHAYHVGDEAMTHAVAHALTARGHTPVLLTRDLADSRARFGGEVDVAGTLVFPWPPVDRERYLGEIQDVLAGNPRALPADDQIHAFVEAVRSCDALVVAGGGNLNSRYGWLLHERAAALAVAHHLGLPTYVTGQTIGPALTRRDAATLREAFANTLGVAAREEPTRRLAAALTAPERVARVLDDASFLSLVPLPDAAPGVPGEAADHASSDGAIVVTVAHGSLGIDDAALPELAAAIDALATSTGAPVHLVPHMVVPGERHIDLEIHDALADSLTVPAVVLDVEHALVSARRAREAAIVITSRYHPAVFALEGAVPVLGLAADAYTSVRLVGALDNWGVGEESVLLVDDVAGTPGLLTRRLLALWEGRDAVADGLRAARPALAAAADEFWDVVVAALGSATSPSPAPSLPTVPRIPVPGAPAPHATPADGDAPAAPVVSVVVRTKDRPHMLGRALDDIAAQTFPSLEVVVVNDAGDRDAVDEVVAATVGLAGRVRVLHREVSTGMEAASNAGIALAHGELVSIHDDDDTWDPQFLARTVAHLHRHPEQRAVAARTEIVWERIDPDTGLAVEESREVFEPRVRIVTVSDLLRYNRMVPISLLLRRSVLEEIGSFDESFGVVGDWEFNLRLAALGPVTVLPGPPLAFWHQRRASTGVLGNSVIVAADEHLDVDLRLRDERLRRRIAEKGDGDLLYLTRFMHERHEELAGHLLGMERRLTEVVEQNAALEERLGRAVEAIEVATRDAGFVGLARRKYWSARTSLRDRRNRR